MKNGSGLCLPLVGVLLGVEDSCDALRSANDVVAGAQVVEDAVTVDDTAPPLNVHLQHVDGKAGGVFNCFTATRLRPFGCEHYVGYVIIVKLLRHYEQDITLREVVVFTFTAS